MNYPQPYFLNPFAINDVCVISSDDKSDILPSYDDAVLDKIIKV